MRFKVAERTIVEQQDKCELEEKENRAVQCGENEWWVFICWVDLQCSIPVKLPQVSIRSMPDNQRVWEEKGP